ncbi:MAG: fumarylacetoacetase [Actinomycetes bacterium]
MTLSTWVPVPERSHFGVANLPYGVFSTADEPPRVGVRIGDHVLDVAPVAGVEGLDGGHVFVHPSLNALMALGRPAWTAVRDWLTELVTHESQRDLVEPHLVPVSDVTMHMPFEVADYVDFYSSEHHATNVGRMFRPGSDPLTPNWRHLPIGYHGRAGTVVPSGTPVVRPSGQRKETPEAGPTYGPSARLDIEAEVGFVVGVPSPLGSQVPTSALREHVFGVVLVNDWSARDLQVWESVPLGPFLGKSFATSVSPWVVTLDALEGARVTPPAQDPPPQAYLRDTEDWGLDLALEIELNGHVVSRPPFSTMYWTPAQQLAHMTVNGASLRTGDLYASGTVSGPAREQRGSLLELAWAGEQPLSLPDGSTRVFLADGDTVTIRATAPGTDGSVIGFGEVTGTVAPAGE